MPHTSVGEKSSSAPLPSKTFIVYSGFVRKGLVAAVGAAMLSLPLAGLGLSRAAAAAPTTFQATAAADGFRVSVEAPKLSVVDTLVDLGGPSAQATVDGLGSSVGFAAYPNPGELVLTGPGLVAGASGGAVSFPPYPFAVESSYPSVKEAHADNGVYVLRASSTQRRSTAAASSGSADPAVTRVASTATAALEGDVTLSQATSTVEALALGPLHMARSDARAAARLAPGQAPKLSAEFTVTGMDVNGTSIAIGPSGLVLAGTTAPLPATDPVRAALAGAGIELSYLAPRLDKGTARSGGIQITLHQVLSQGVPGAIPAGQVVDYRVVLGQAVASAAASAGAATGLGSLLGSAPVDLPAASAELPASTENDAEPAAAAAPAVADSAGLVMDGVARPAAVRAVPIRPAALETSPRVEGLNVYWVLVVGAAAAGLALRFNRTTRRRNSWPAVLERVRSEGASS
jgi:hypothetical protein